MYIYIKLWLWLSIYSAVGATPGLLVIASYSRSGLLKQPGRDREKNNITITFGRKHSQAFRFHDSDRDADAAAVLTHMQVI